MKFAEFLVANQDWVAPVVEWGGAILLTLVVISPFFIIRHRIFRPTRWWHIVGAYVGSILIFTLLTEISILLFLNATVSDFFRGIFPSIVPGAIAHHHYVLLMILYPLLVFYSTYLLYGAIRRFQFWAATGIAISMFFLFFFFKLLALITFLAIFYINAYFFS